MKNNLSNIKKAINYLNNDECVAIPTETVYGLAGNAYSNKATSKIFKLKKRPKKNPLIVHYYEIKMLEKDCELNKNFFKLYKKFSPGALTYVLKKKRNSSISRNVTNGMDTLGVRFPSNSITKKILKNLKYPLAAPSANIYKKISAVSPQDVQDEFKNKIKFILNGGRSKIGVESTIISLIGKPKILRLGGIEKEKIEKILKIKIKLQKNVKKIMSPGQGNVHYSPDIPIRLNADHRKMNEAFILINKRNLSDKNFFYLTKNKNLKEAAKNLYMILRIIKKKKFKSIAVERIPNIGFGEVINDRLMRATKK